VYATGIGIDISKRKVDVCIRTQQGTVESFAVPNDSDGVRILQEKIKPYPDSKIVMESTGNLWLRIYESLEDHNVSLANPLKTKAISESRIKHDRLDASVLAELARADLVSECYVPDRNTRDVRDLVRHRIELVKDRTRHKNRIHSILDKYWLRYDGVLFTAEGIRWLRSQKMRETDSQIVRSHLRQIDVLTLMIQQIESQIASIALRDRRVRLLLGFCGIDYYGAMLVLHEIGDISRFPNPKKLVLPYKIIPNPTVNLSWCDFPNQDVCDLDSIFFCSVNS
jgi:transposase